MSLQIHPSKIDAVPRPSAGATPAPPVPLRTSVQAADGIAAGPRAHPAVPTAAAPRHLVDGTPEVVVAGLGLAGLAAGADVAALATAAAVRAGTSYISRLTRSILHCVADPAKTGEHIAEGLVGGAAWAGAAAGVSALAEAARQHGASPRGGVPH